MSASAKHNKHGSHKQHVLCGELSYWMVNCRKKNNIVYMKEHGFAEEMLDGLLNLDLALQCDGFVSSINSNWAR
jgi:hypothetical protein